MMGQNEAYVRAASAAIRAYTDSIVGIGETSGTDDSGDLECLLASLRHWAAAKCVDYRRENARARKMYECEIEPVFLARAAQGEIKS